MRVEFYFFLSFFLSLFSFCKGRLENYRSNNRLIDEKVG